MPKDIVKWAVVGAVLYYLARREVSGGVQAVKEARENASAKLTDIFARFTGLAAREERIWSDPDYRRRYLAALAED